MITLRIIPAASALPVLYDNVVKTVAAHGYDIQALHIPSVGLVSGARPGEPPSMYDDAAFIAAHVTDLVDAGNDVLLITHSYGGVPATQSIKGLTKVEREEAGKPGGVVGLAYMTSLVPEVGMPAANRSLSPLMEIGEDGWFCYPDNNLVARISFSDMPQDEGESWAKKLVKHSAASFSNPLTYAGYKHVPVSYLIAEGDQSISPETQRSQIEMIERASGNKVNVTITSAGHAPPLSAPDDVINWILAVAKKLQ